MASRGRNRWQRDGVVALLATGVLLACGGSSTRTLSSRQSGGAGEDPGGRAGASNAGAGALAAGGAANGNVAGGGGAKLGGSAGVPAHAGVGTSNESAGAGNAGRGDVAGAGGAPSGLGGHGGAGATAGAPGGAGSSAQGGTTGGAGSPSGGRGPAGAGGAGGQATCRETVMAYCAAGGASATSNCPLDWSQASDLSQLCAQYPRVLRFDCSDGQAVLVGGVDTSTSYYFDSQTHALVEVDANGNGRNTCLAGPTIPLARTLPTCTPVMPCVAGAGGQGG